jgi:AmmeMemoRadiSam system protein B/AmmeMemoRadiSam system protein A
MKHTTIVLVLYFSLSVITMNCKSQDKGDYAYNTYRKAVAAGKFYESDSSKLQNELKTLFENAIPYKLKNIIALISPHAGFIFSGQVAANAYMQLDQTKLYKRIFIIAPSHYTAFNGASIYNQGDYITPLGKVEVDCELANKLMRKNSAISYFPGAHLREHAIEVQLPFIQAHLKNGYKIVPIVIGTQNNEILKKIAKTLKEYLNSENLFIISSDFSHYPNYSDANTIDRKSATAILTNSPDKLIEHLKKTEAEYITNLATCMCGESAIVTLLYMSTEMKGVAYELIDYKNSGDSEYGSKDRVVGYCAIALAENKESDQSAIKYTLTVQDKNTLLAISRKTLEEYIRKGKKTKLDTNNYSDNLKMKCGAFVTLTIDGQLRGCIGSFSTEIPISQLVQDMTISASSKDPRFDKVKAEELRNIEIEISLLSPMQKIDSISQIEIGKHGIFIRNGYRQGTLLPQVATGNKWTAEEFVKYCAIYKAGISESEIKNAELYVYESFVFKEHKVEK